MEVFGNSCFFGGREFLLGYSGPTAVGRRWEDSLVKNFPVKTILVVGKREIFSFFCMRLVLFLYCGKRPILSCEIFPSRVWPETHSTVIILFSRVVVMNTFR